MLVYSLFQFSKLFPEHPELGQACRALGSVKSHSGKGVSRVVACVARGCDCNRLYGSEQQGYQGVSLTCEPLACYPRGLTSENGLKAAATPGILCKRKERAPGWKSVWRHSKQPIRSAWEMPAAAVFQETTKAWPPSCDDGPGAFPRSPLRPGETSDAFATCEGPLSDGGGGRRCRGPASGERLVHGICRKLLKSNPGWFFRGTVE